MPTFFQSSKSSSGNKHTHIIYMREDRTGSTSVNQKHSHNIEEYIDNTGSTNYRLTVVDGHTHKIEKPLKLMKQYKPGEGEKREEIVSDVHQLYEKAEGLNRENFKNAKKCVDFKNNKQWGEDVKNSLNRSDRAVLTVNIVNSITKTLLGIQMQNETDLVVYPIEDGDGVVCDILNVLLKTIFDNNNLSTIESKIFEDMIVTGKGYFEVFIDYSKDIKGNIIINSYPWRSVYDGEHENIDYSDLEFLVKFKYLTKNNLKSLYPNKSNEIDNMFTGKPNLFEITGDYGEDSEKFAYAKKLGYNYYSDIDLNTRTSLIKECWRKEYKREYIIFDLLSGEPLKVNNLSIDDINRIKTIQDLKVINRAKTLIRVTKITGDIILSDEYWDYNNFNLIPAYSDYSDSVWFGKIFLILDLQREINKRYSTLADILNKVNAYGVFYTDDAFDDGLSEDQLRSMLSTPGFAKRVTSIDSIKIVDGISYPSEMDRANLTSLQLLEYVSGVNRELMGQRSNVESNVGLVQKERQSMYGNEYLFSHLSIAKQELGRQVIQMIPEVYDVERIKRILNNQNNKESNGIQLGGKDLNAYNDEEITSLLNKIINGNLLKYDVKIDEKSASPTMKMAWAETLIKAAGQGVPVPMEQIISMLPLIPSKLKNQMIQGIQQQQQGQVQSDKQKFDTEIIKSLPDDVKVPMALNKMQQGGNVNGG